MRKFTLLLLIMFGLAACNNGDDDNGVVVNPPTTTPPPTAEPPTPDPVPNQLKDLAAQSANDEAGAIGNAADLTNDINALFNAVEPVEVEAGDTITDVINRAEGS